MPQRSDILSAVRNASTTTTDVDCNAVDLSSPGDTSPDLSLEDEEYERDLEYNNLVVVPDIEDSECKARLLRHVRRSSAK
jgi:hypothetical protein